MHSLAGRRVLELQHEGMQRLTVELVDDGLGGIRQKVRLGSEGSAIFGIADQRVADMCHMYADLMGPARFEVAFDRRGERGAIGLFEIALDHLVMGDRLAGVVAILALDRALRSVAGAAERLLERLTESRLEVDRSEVLLRSLLPRAERELDEWSCSDCAGAAERVGSGAFACWPTESWTGSGLGFGAGCS